MVIDAGLLARRLYALFDQVYKIRRSKFAKAGEALGTGIDG
jgi:hypothetical protein